MKIFVCGKGGSGKSTIISLLAFSFQRRGKKVFILDSDESNNNLYWMVGFDAPPRDLMDYAGGKSEVKKRMSSRFSKGEDEPRMSVMEETIVHPDSLPNEFIAKNDGLALMVTGKIHHALEGCACAMGSVTREFVKNTQMNTDEVMLIDTEAGIEHFGRGVEAGADGVIAIAEPSLESIELAKTIKKLTLVSGSKFLGVIVNKTNSDKQKEIVSDNLLKSNVPLVGFLEYNSDLQDACLSGAPLSDTGLENKIDGITENILKITF